jgi:hypothetical protein
VSFLHGVKIGHGFYYYYYFSHDTQWVVFRTHRVSWGKKIVNGPLSFMKMEVGGLSIVRRVSPNTL